MRDLVIKVTKKLLNDYRKTKREIPLLEAELEGMQQGDAGFGSSTIFDYRSGFPRAQAVVGFDWALFERRERTLKKKKDEVKAVKQWIDNIEDGQTRCVFRMFYIDGMSWVKIADRIGYGGNTDYPRLCIRDLYLKKCGIK